MSIAPLVRPGTPADLPAIGRLGALLVEAHHQFDAQRFLAPQSGTASGYASYLGSQLGKPDVAVLVVEVSGEVIGYAYAGVEGPDYMSLRGPAGIVYDIVVESC